jgi:hypothetical protein
MPPKGAGAYPSVTDGNAVKKQKKRGLQKEDTNKRNKK